jgi:hypothetical protein
MVLNPFIAFSCLWDAEIGQASSQCAGERYRHCTAVCRGRGMTSRITPGPLFWNRPGIPILQVPPKGHRIPWTPSATASVP